RVRVESLTKTPTFNRSAKLTCEEFSQVEAPPPPPAPAASAEQPGADQGTAGGQDVFWQSLHELCGKAYAHIQNPPVPSTPILDARRCDEETVQFGAHYLTAAQEKTWNRGQPWLLSKAPDGLHMKYPRRESAQPDAKHGGWSAATKDSGTPELQ